MECGSIVVLHLVNPTEKYWGRLEALGPVGVTLRGLALASFDDWLGELASGEPPSMSLATIFFPLHRVERMFLDEAEGALASLAQRCEQRLGRPVAEIVGAPSVSVRPRLRTPRSAGRTPSARSRR